jgi:hypothetical protein
MRWMKWLLIPVIVLTVAGAASAGPVLNGGWYSYDYIDYADTPSLQSPYLYNLGGTALFSLSDCCVVGDTWKIYDFGSLILTTSLAGAMAPFPGYNPSEWTDPAFSHGQVLLGTGSHELVVKGDGLGGLAAGFYTRLDSVPDAGSSMLLLGIGLAGLRAWRKRD